MAQPPGTLRRKKVHSRCIAISQLILNCLFAIPLHPRAVHPTLINRLMSIVYRYLQGANANGENVLPSPEKYKEAYSPLTSECPPLCYVNFVLGDPFGHRLS